MAKLVNINTQMIPDYSHSQSVAEQNTELRSCPAQQNNDLGIS